MSKQKAFWKKKMNMLLTFDAVELHYLATYHLKALDKYYTYIYIDRKKSLLSTVLWSYHVTNILATHLIKF